MLYDAMRERNEKLRKRITTLFIKGLTYGEIATKVGVSRQRVQQIVRPPADIYNKVRDRAKACCQKCGISVPIGGHVHHLKAEGRTVNNINNVNNLQYLCRTCHRIEHTVLGSQWWNVYYSNAAIKRRAIRAQS